MAKRIKEKALARKQNADKRPSAIVKYVGVSPIKVKIVLDAVRGLNANEAMAILDNMNNASAPTIKKLIASAVANAEHNLSMDTNDLVVAEIYCTPGPTMKRVDFRARGRRDIIIKRSSHITVKLEQTKA